MKKVKRQPPPAPGNGPGYFFVQANTRALDYANEALDLARKDVLDLQGKTLNTVEQMCDATGDFGVRLFRSIEAHAGTREFGALIWERALIGKAVHEVAERVAARLIEEREARRPHRRAIAWVKGILAELGIIQPIIVAAVDVQRDGCVTWTATAIEADRMRMLAGREEADRIAAKRDAVARALEEGELGEGTDAELQDELLRKSQTGSTFSEYPKPPGDDAPAPRTTDEGPGYEVIPHTDINCRACNAEVCSQRATA